MMVGRLHRDFVGALDGGGVDGIRKRKVGDALCRGGRAWMVEARRVVV